MDFEEEALADAWFLDALPFSLCSINLGIAKGINLLIYAMGSISLLSNDENLNFSQFPVCTEKLKLMLHATHLSQTVHVDWREGLAYDLLSTGTLWRFSDIDIKTWDSLVVCLIKI